MSSMKLGQIAATAGNAVANISPGQNWRRWKIHRLYITLTTDGTAATRNILVYNFNTTAGTVVGINFKGADRAASGTTRLAAGPEVVGTGAAYIYEANVQLNFPITLDGSQALQIAINNGVAGDSYSCNYIYEEEASGS